MKADLRQIRDLGIVLLLGSMAVGVAVFWPDAFSGILLVTMIASIVLVVWCPVKWLAVIQGVLTGLVVIILIAALPLVDWFAKASVQEQELWKPRFEMISWGTFAPWVLFTACHVLAVGWRALRPTISRALIARRWPIILGVFVVLCVSVYAVINRHFCYIHGYISLESPAQLGADDLADNLISRKGVAALQEWSLQTMARQRAGQLATTGRGTLATNEIPDWICGGWAGPPRGVAVAVDPSNGPICVVFRWYSGGLPGGVVVGPTNFVMDSQMARQVKPGIYAYYGER